jgi:hypothetical protein
MNPSDLEEKQELLDQRGIQIELEKFPESLRTHPIVFDLALCKTIFKAARYKTITDEANLVKGITYDQLDQGLSLVCRNFEKQVRELNDPTFSYGVHVHKFKSSEWITTRMLRLLPRDLMPSQEIGYRTEQIPLLGMDGFMNIALMDECHYSGDQITLWLKNISIREEHPPSLSKRKFRFWILAPFVSPYTENRLKSLLNTPFHQTNGLDIRLISTDLKFPQLSTTRYLLLPEWKAPDGLSFPVTLSLFCSPSGSLPLYKEKYWWDPKSHHPSIGSLEPTDGTRPVAYPSLPKDDLKEFRYADPEASPFSISVQDSQKLSQLGLNFDQNTGVISGNVMESVRLQAKPFYILFISHLRQGKCLRLNTLIMGLHVLSLIFM